jgi:5-methylcytosine-specific restriction endonuclease McrA
MKDYIKGLDDPQLDPGRRLALEIILAARERSDTADLREPSGIEKQLDYLCFSFACANCDTEIIDRAAVFCDRFCAEVASTVRYARGTIRDGRIANSDVQEALEAKLLMLTGGGYPKEQRRLTQAERRAIFERDNSKCQICGAAATEIDHVRGNSDDFSNLRAVCGQCNRRAAFANARIITRKDNPKEWRRLQQLYNDVALRIGATQPIRLCDDPTHWASCWSGILAERRRTFRESEEELESDFEDVDGYLYHTMQKDD